MATNSYITKLKARIDQAITQRDHWKQLAENRNSIVVTEVCPESRSVEEYIIDADSVKASWRLIRGYREQIDALRLQNAMFATAAANIDREREALRAEAEALRAENARLRVKLMAIASAEPARHGIEWAKAIAAEGNGEPYAKWREAIAERDALAAELDQAREEIEGMHKSLDKLRAQCAGFSAYAEIDRLTAELAAIKRQEPDCDRSACGDFSPGRCDNPDCSARRDRKPALPAAPEGGEV